MKRKVPNTKPVGDRPSSSAKDLAPLRLPPQYVVDPIASGLANRIREARGARGLTLDALNLLTRAVDPDGRGISRNSLSRYESQSGADPGARELRLISQALRKPLAWFLYGDHDDPMNFATTEPLELLVEDYVAKAIDDALARKGLAVPDENAWTTWRAKHEEIVEAAKKLAKDDG